MTSSIASAPSLPRVSIVIPCRNEARSLPAFLSSLEALEYPADKLEILIIDGISTDGTRELLIAQARSTPDTNTSSASTPAPPSASIRRRNLVILDNPAQTTPAALNLGIRAATGEVIVRMDCHTEYAPDYVLRCVETLQRTSATNVGGPARTRTSSYLQQAIAAAYHSPFSTGGARFHDVAYEGPVDTVTYGCWRRDAFDRFGFFDEELIRNQDDEHNLRITRGGGGIWQDPAIRSWYHPRSSLSALLRQYAQYGYWKVRVIRKHALPASWRHLAPAALLVTIACCALLSPFSAAARSATAAILSLYLIALIVASVITATRSRPSLLPILPIVFATYHFGYGAGFLTGITHHLTGRRRQAGSFATLTRTSP